MCLQTQTQGLPHWQQQQAALDGCFFLTGAAEADAEAEAAAELEPDWAGCGAA